MQRNPWPDAYALVESLRPRWLRAHGPDGLQGQTVEVQVYLDDARLGGVAALRGIAVTDIAYIRFVDPVAAAARWGGEHINGAIYVSTRPR
jgi:hypothetical protein